MTTATHPEAPGEGARADTTSFARTQQQAITGRYRPITTHKLALIWWLHRAGHITRRQLRVAFAAHEMAERRRYTGNERRGHARYRLEEIKGLIGGRDSKSASRDLSADVRALAALGLVTITSKSITFAVSVEQIAIEGDLDDFWAFFNALPRQRGTVPVPRRTLRALAAGFGRAETALILACLIRSVFWHKKDGCYSTDGRTKGSWVADTFGLSRRSITAARSHLIELGWLQPRETPQWALNKWGAYDVVNVDWAPAEQAVDQPGAANEPVENTDPGAVGEGRGAGGSATPATENAGGSASPDLNRSSSSSRNLKTRRLGDTPPDPSGDCIQSEGKGTKRENRAGHAPPAGKPNIRDVRSADLRDPGALLELHRQAVAIGLTGSSPSAELEFFALAHRARTRGHRPGALFYDLLKNQRTAFITIADEEAARRQLRELRDGPTQRSSGGGGATYQEAPVLSQDQRFVLACQKAAPRARVYERPGELGAFWAELYRAFRPHLPEGWTEDRWTSACFSLQQQDTRRWAAITDSDEGNEHASRKTC